MTALIRNPLNYVTVRTMAECHCCESEYQTLYSHSQYAGMWVCADCLSNYGGWHGHPRDSAKAIEAWDAIAKYLSR